MAQPAVISTPELSESIVSHVDSEADLLHLALTCSYFCSIIIPRHLHYRTIRCTMLEGFRLWRRLAHDKNLAQNVRSFERARIISDGNSTRQWRGPVLPDIMYEDRLPDGVAWYSMTVLDFVLRQGVEGPLEFTRGHNDAIGLRLECEQLLKSALKNMTYLSRYECSSYHPLDSDIWEILVQYSSLREVIVTDLNMNPGVDVFASNMWHLRGLVEFRYKTTAYTHQHLVPLVSKFQSLLADGCPNLETLCIEFANLNTLNSPLVPALNGFFEHTLWERLRRLRLIGLWTDIAPIITFLEAHSSVLEDLALDESIGMHELRHSHLTIKLDAPFPRLCQLDVPKVWSLAILNSTLRTAALPCMTALRGLHFNGGERTASLGHLAHLQGLRELRVAGVDLSTPDDLQRIAGLVPDLEVLALPNTIDRGMDINITSVTLVQFSQLVVWTSGLRGFHKLRAIRSCTIFNGHESNDHKDALASGLLRACPTLHEAGRNSSRNPRKIVLDPVGREEGGVLRHWRLEGPVFELPIF